MQFCPFLVSFWEAGIQAAKQDEKNYSANGRKQCQGWAEGDRKPEGESPPVATYVLPIGFFKVFIESVSLLFSWSQRPDLNRGPTDYESVALPTELRWPKRGRPYRSLRSNTSGEITTVELTGKDRINLKTHYHAVVAHLQFHLTLSQQHLSADMRQHHSL